MSNRIQNETEHFFFRKMLKKVTVLLITIFISVYSTHAPFKGYINNAVPLVINKDYEIFPKIFYS